MLSEFLKKSFCDTFTLAKLHYDLFYFISEMNFADLGNNNFTVDVLITPGFNHVKMILNENDNIKIISYKSLFKFETDLYYEVVVGLGEYTSNKVSDSFFSIEKCLAKLKYNEDYSLYDVEFYIDQVNMV
jgi:hypothetical protein